MVREHVGIGVHFAVGQLNVDMKMRKIELTKNNYAIVDDSDYEWLSQYKWHISCGYAETSKRVGNKIINTRMHRMIINPSREFQIDHINGDKLDNRRINLRICTASQNKANVDKPITNKSGYKGVSFHKITGKYRAVIKINGKYKHLGEFDNPEDAAVIYDINAKKYFGEFCRVNFLMRN